MTSLRTRMTEDMQIRNLAVHTQNTYLLQVALFARHFNKSPELLGPEQIRTYQVYLTNEKKLATSSILIATCNAPFRASRSTHQEQEIVCPVCSAGDARAERADTFSESGLKVVSPACRG